MRCRVRAIPQRITCNEVTDDDTSNDTASALSDRPVPPGGCFRRAGQGGEHRAGLVVRFEDGSVQTTCVSFSEPSISGEQLLNRSGLAVAMNYNAGLGGAVCSINGNGCPVTDCFCRCQGIQCEYWAYYHGSDGGWQYASTGTSSYQVTDGALEGWSWGNGSFGTSGIEPPAMTFDEVCPPPATATPTATATLAPTATPSPTATTVQSLVFLPLLTFNADNPTLAPNACTVLRWTTSDADQVTLDGALVAAQGQRNVCPSATQRYVLVAANAAGQIASDVVVTVPDAGDAPAPPVLLTAAAPAWTATALPSSTPTILPSTNGTTGANFAPSPVPPLPGLTPQPGRPAARGAVPVAYAQELATATPVAVAPAATPLPAQRALSVSVPTSLSPTTPTPRSRRVIGADGRPTPTPILLARCQPPAAQARPGGRRITPLTLRWAARPPTPVSLIGLFAWLCFPVTPRIC